MLQDGTYCVILHIVLLWLYITGVLLHSFWFILQHVSEFGWLIDWNRLFVCCTYHLSIVSMLVCMDVSLHVSAVAVFSNDVIAVGGWILQSYCFGFTWSWLSAVIGWLTIVSARPLHCCVWFLFHSTVTSHLVDQVSTSSEQINSMC